MRGFMHMLFVGILAQITMNKGMGIIYHLFLGHRNIVVFENLILY